MTDTTDRMGELNADPRLDPEERSLYRLVGYMLVAFVLVSSIAARVLPEHAATAATAFVVVFGSWFVDRAKRVRISLVRWLVFSVCAAAAVTLVAYAVARLLPAS